MRRTKLLLPKVLEDFARLIFEEIDYDLSNFLMSRRMGKMGDFIEFLLLVYYTFSSLTLPCWNVSQILSHPHIKLSKTLI